MGRLTDYLAYRLAAPPIARADDVLKARLKTVGVSEYRFEMELAAGRDSGTEWRIVDVGGSRSQVSFSCPFCVCFLCFHPSSFLPFRL